MKIRGSKVFYIAVQVLLLLRAGLALWHKCLLLSAGLQEVKVYRVRLFYDAHEGRHNVLCICAMQARGTLRIAHCS